MDSKIYPGERLIDDNSPIVAFDTPSGMSKGYEGMHRKGYSGANDYEPFPDNLLIDRSEWEDRVREMETNQSRLSDLINYYKLPPKNQQSTNYCWINAPTSATEINRLVMNQPMVILSPASAGGPITGFKNVGGWGEDGLKWIAQHGLVPVSHWPANAIQKNLYTEANKKLALDYRVTEWWKLEPNTIEQTASCLLRRIPVPVGYDWWGHEVTAIDLVFINGKPAFRIRNSWGDTSDYPNGYGILQGKKMIPNDAVAPRQTIAV